MNNKIDLVIDIANKANQYMNANNLVIPILDNFTIVDKKENENETYFVALYNNYLEQFYKNNPLEESETIDDRINSIYQSIKDNIANNELYDDNKIMVYYKDYNNKEFNFKLYVQDVLSGTKDDIKLFRQLNGYFINPLTNDFYQLSISSGPYDTKRYKLLKDINELDKDELVMILEKALNVVMDNIHFE